MRLALILYSDLEQEKYFPASNKDKCMTDRVLINDKEVTDSCYSFLSIFGFGYVKCYKLTNYNLSPNGVKKFTLDHPVFYMEGDSVAREPTKYGRVKVKRRK